MLIHPAEKLYAAPQQPRNRKQKLDHPFRPIVRILRPVLLDIFVQALLHLKNIIGGLKINLGHRSAAFQTAALQHHHPHRDLVAGVKIAVDNKMIEPRKFINDPYVGRQQNRQPGNLHAAFVPLAVDIIRNRLNRDVDCHHIHGIHPLIHDMSGHPIHGVV